MSNNLVIDASRINLLEKDIEDWLYENPSALGCAWGVIEEWLGRQYKLPSGIADLVGVLEDGVLLVVEIKNVEINKAAVLQVLRYAHDLQEIGANRMDFPRVYPQLQWSEPVVRKVLVGPSIDGQTFTEAKACGVQVVTFEPRMYLTTSNLGWSTEFYSERAEMYEEIARGQEWERFGEHISDHVERQQQSDQLSHELDEELGQLLDAAESHDISDG